VNMCFGFGCRRQQKHHAAAPPPAGVQRRMERNRQKLVGRDKGSLTEQQTKGNSNNNDTDKEKIRHKLAQQTRSPEQDRRPRSPAASQFPQRGPPPPEPSVTAHGMEYPALFGQVGSAPTAPAVPLPGQTQDNMRCWNHFRDYHPSCYTYLLLLVEVR